MSFIYHFQNKINQAGMPGNMAPHVRELKMAMAVDKAGAEYPGKFLYPLPGFFFIDQVNNYPRRIRYQDLLPEDTVPVENMVG